MPRVLPLKAERDAQTHVGERARCSGIDRLRERDRKSISSSGLPAEHQTDGRVFGLRGVVENDRKGLSIDAIGVAFGENKIGSSWTGCVDNWFNKGGNVRTDVKKGQAPGR